MKATLLLAALLLSACTNTNVCSTWEQDIGNRSTGTVRVCGDV